MLFLWYQMTYLLLPIARYCQIFLIWPNIVQCCAILYNIVKYCLILLNIVQVAISAPSFLSCNNIFRNVKGRVQN